MAPCAINYIFERAVGRIYPKGSVLDLTPENGNLDFVFIVSGCL
jgi:hypothetical protein